MRVVFLPSICHHIKNNTLVGHFFVNTIFQRTPSTLLKLFRTHAIY